MDSPNFFSQILTEEYQVFPQRKIEPGFIPRLRKDQSYFARIIDIGFLFFLFNADFKLTILIIK
jgi:hypothetical protein